MSNSVTINGMKFESEVAITEAEQNYGLMNKAWPPPVMFFPYKYSGVRKFWMKNTPSPLDIIFCRDNRIISIVAGEPMSTMMVGPDEPADLVVELPSGTAQVQGFTVGDVVHVKYSTETAAKYLTA